MAILTDPGQSLPITISLGASPINRMLAAQHVTPIANAVGKSAKLHVTAASRLKLVTAETSSKGENLIAPPIIQYWG